MTEPDPPVRRYFILSLDGGGVRCALQIILLKRIFAKFPSLESRICLVAGTSAGALVGSVLSALGVEKMLEHMSTQAFAKKIFAESWTHEVRSMKGLYRANYTNRELSKLLETVFGIETKLDHFKQTSGKSDLLITAFRIDTAVETNCKTCLPPTKTATKSTEIELSEIKRDTKSVEQEPEEEKKHQEVIKKDEEESRWTRLVGMLRWRSATAAAATMPTTPALVNNVNATAIIQEACNQQKQHQGAQHKCNCVSWHAQLYHTFESNNASNTFVDVLLKTTAAPTYFPAHQGCIDGGVIAQNPSLLALTFALRYGKIDGHSVQLKDVVLLSLGTGSHPMNMNTYGAAADLGLAQWAPNLMCLFNDASLDAAEINCRNLLGDNYIRVQVKMPRDIDLANYNEWNELVRWAENQDLTELFEKLQILTE